MKGKSGQGSLSHLDESGEAKMVDVGGKKVARREARAEAWISMSPGTLELVASGSLPKGDVFSAARLAGIMAAKKTPDLIPLCHAISVDSVSVDFSVDGGSSRIGVFASVRASDRTGAEMEALVCAAVAALTIYDMCKAAERGVEIDSLRLTFKSGGKSGTWERGS